MIKAIKGRNCELADPLVVCAPIPKAPIEGGYNHDRRQVLVNSLVIKSQSDALTLLLHELTHAYDSCRVYIDPGNCRHSACSEVSPATCCPLRVVAPTLASTRPILLQRDERPLARRFAHPTSAPSAAGKTNGLARGAPRTWASGRSSRPA